MCGRYASFRQAQDLASAFARAGHFQDVLFQPEALTAGPNFNVAPTTNIPIIVDRTVSKRQAQRLMTAQGKALKNDAYQAIPADQTVRQVQLARWGLVPGWAKDPAVGVKMINARSETLLEKASFKRAFSSQRCIIPADGYYEWQAPRSGSGPKTPTYITPADGSGFAFAGLYEFWRPPAPEHGDTTAWLVTATIITAQAHGELGQVHDRRPVFLSAHDYDCWLDPKTSGSQVLDLFAAPALATTHHAVSTRVNSVANNDPSLIEPDLHPKPEQGLLL